MCYEFNKVINKIKTSGMQLLKILGILLLAGVPAALVFSIGFFLPVDWFELREIIVFISCGAIFLSVICYFFGFWTTSNLIKLFETNSQKFIAFFLAFLSLVSFVCFSFGIAIWHGAGTHFVQNCGDFSILRTNGSGSTCKGYYSDEVRINGYGNFNTCQEFAQGIVKVENCSVKPIFIKKSDQLNQYCQIEFSSKNFFKVKNLNRENLTELINCLVEKSLEIKFNNGNSTVCLTNNVIIDLKENGERLLDVMTFNIFGNQIVYNILQKVAS